MPIIQSFISNNSRDNVIKYIKNKKENGKFTVIDIGGSADGWSAPYIDALVDMNESNSNFTFQRFYGDINKDKVWNDVKEYVMKNGKFDFCICTHTLEDIRDPLFVCEQMQEIAYEGYIAVPSKYIECARFEFGNNGPRGYIHHRWIFIISNNQFKGFPKLSFLEYMRELDNIASTNKDRSDLSFYWKDNIPIILCNNDYMGPSVEHVKDYFRELIKN